MPASKTLIALVLAPLLHASLASSQNFSAGVLVGSQTVPVLMNDSKGEVHTNRFLVAPAVAFGLSSRLSLELAAFRKNLSNNRTAVHSFDKYTGASYEQRDTTGNAWELPLLLKWYVSGRPARAFIATGVSFRHMSGTTHVFGTDLGSGLLPTRRAFDFEESFHLNTYGPSVVLGADIYSGRSWLHFVPQARYTHFVDRIRKPAVTSSADIVDFLVGITFTK